MDVDWTKSAKKVIVNGIIFGAMAFLAQFLGQDWAAIPLGALVTGGVNYVKHYLNL